MQQQGSGLRVARSARVEVTPCTQLVKCALGLVRWWCCDFEATRKCGNLS